MARGTRIYTVHLRPESAAPDREAVLIREGFAFWAGLLTVLWALRHRLWFWAIILFAVQIGLTAAVDFYGLTPLVLLASGVALFLLVGFEAADWRRAALARRGWVLADVVSAPNPEEALRRSLIKLAMPRRNPSAAPLAFMT